MKNKIPTKFYKEGKHPIAKTVGELIAILSELPPELPVESKWGKSAQVVVYNAKYPDRHAVVEEPDED